MAAGLFVDPAPGPVLANFGVDHLRFLTPGQGRRLDPGDADRQADHPALLGRLRRGALGRAGHQRDDEPVATYDVLTLVAKEA